MALRYCSGCGKEYNDDPKLFDGEVHCPFCGLLLNSQQDKVSVSKEKKGEKHTKRWKFIVVIAIIVSILIYKNFIVRTVDSGNGWKHQIGHFGDCEFSQYYGCEEATHRIHSFFVNENYCDECWNGHGKKIFESLVERETSVSDSKDSTNAKICAEQAVKDNLKSPSTAKFCGYLEMTATDLGKGRWKVTGYVDAQNSFGAVVRQTWTVTLTLTTTGFTDVQVSFSE